MNLDLITKADLKSLEERVEELISTYHSREVKGLGIVYTTKELSQKLKVSTKTINNWREARLIEFCKVQNTVLFTEAAIKDFLSKHSIKSKKYQ